MFVRFEISCTFQFQMNVKHQTFQMSNFKLYKRQTLQTQIIKTLFFFHPM